MVALQAEQPETELDTSLKDLDIQGQPENGDQDLSDDDEEKAGADEVTEGRYAKMKLKGTS